MQIIKAGQRDLAQMAFYPPIRKEVASEVLDSRPTTCVFNLPIEKDETHD